MSVKSRQLHTKHKTNIANLKKSVKTLRKTVNRDQKKDSKRICELKKEQREKEKQAYSESPYAIYQEAIDP